MGSEEGTCRDGHRVLPGNRCDDKVPIKTKKHKRRVLETDIVREPSVAEPSRKARGGRVRTHGPPGRHRVQRGLDRTGPGSCSCDASFPELCAGYKAPHPSSFSPHPPPLLTHHHTFCEECRSPHNSLWEPQGLGPRGTQWKQL